MKRRRPGLRTRKNKISNEKSDLDPWEFSVQYLYDSYKLTDTVLGTLQLNGVNECHIIALLFEYSIGLVKFLILSKDV